MKYFKDEHNNFFAYEADGSQDHLIKDKTPVTEEEVIAANAIKRQKEFDSLTYSQKRAREYPPMTDYLDGIVKGDQAQIDAYIAACKSVKNKYPKE